MLVKLALRNPISTIVAMFQNTLLALKIYNLCYIHYRLSALPVNNETHVV